MRSSASGSATGVTTARLHERRFRHSDANGGTKYLTPQPAASPYDLHAQRHRRPSDCVATRWQRHGEFYGGSIQSYPPTPGIPETRRTDGTYDPALANTTNAPFAHNDYLKIHVSGEPGGTHATAQFPEMHEVGQNAQFLAVSMHCKAPCDSVHVLTMYVRPLASLYVALCSGMMQALEQYQSLFLNAILLPIAMSHDVSHRCRLCACVCVRMHGHCASCFVI